MAEKSSAAKKATEDQESHEVDENELQRLKEEEKQARQLGEEAKNKVEAKRQLKQRNLDAGSHRPREDELRRLDSSVKKNSTFVRKLRSITEQQRASLTSDLKTLNLTKYIQETAISIAEAKLKVADVGCAVHVSSLLHQRYEEFSSLLFDNLQKIYSTKISKDDDKSSVTSKYRIGLRLLGELVLAGVVNEDLGLSLLSDMLATLMKADSNGHPYLAVVVSFARHCTEDIAGIVPRKQRFLLTKHGIEPAKAELIPAMKQAEFRETLRKYFGSVRDHLLKEHKAMHQRERRNRDILISKGEISEERRVENEAAQKAYDKLLTNTSTLAEVLDEDMPDLPEYKAPEDSDVSIELQFPGATAEGPEAGPNSLWEDEDARSFYESITDITPFVPAILFEGKKKKGSEEASTESADGATSDEPIVSEGAEGTEGDSEPAGEQDEEQMLEQMTKDFEAMAQEDMSEPPPEDPSEEGGGQAAEQASASSILDEFLQRLPRLMNRKFVDEFAVEFCMTMNTKANRRKLAKALFNVEKNRMDLIPFYARLATTLHQCLDDIVPLLVEMLVKELRYQVYKKEQTRIDFKLKNVRFIAELTKFGMCPKIETMKCITILLHNFTHHNLEMACLFVEHCGRFLLRSPDSHLRAKALLQIMVRKKQVQHLDARQVRLVENALYYANPPDTQITRERLPPMLEYIRKLLYKDLTKLNTEKILRQMRKLPWDDPEVYQWAVTGLTQIWNVKYNNIHCMANLLAGLKSYQEDACVRVVDGVLEDVRIGLELNLPKLNQRRVSTLKYLGELYNYTLIESNVIFRTLYLLLSFGANPDGSPSPLDPHHSYFRVRLICLLLDTCGVYFDRGSSKKRLDAFLVFFQCYLFSKRQPLPLEVENLVQDCLEMLRPDLEMFKTPQEAHEAALALEAKFKDKVGHTQEFEEEIEDEEDDRGGGRGPAEEEEEEEDQEDEEEVEEEPEDIDSTKIFEDEAVITEGPKLISCHEDDEFMSALDKLMSDDNTPVVVKGVTVDAAIPLHLKGGGLRQSSASLLEDGGELKMAFKLMTKKGHKQQLKELNIPMESGLAAKLMDSREARKDEHKQMKELVLNYERRQEEEAFQAMMAETATKFHGKVKQPKKPFESSIAKKPSSSPTIKPQQQHMQQVNSPSAQREFKELRSDNRGSNEPRHYGEYRSDNRVGSNDSRYRGDGRGRGRGRGRGGGGRGGGGQKNWHDQKRREQGFQGN